MTSSEQAIANLVYRYAELIDAGDLEGAAALFSHARIKLGEREVDADGVLAVWRRAIILYPCGTPRTKHVVTNTLIEVDEAGGTGTCRSYYTVFQQAGDSPLQPIICGRYHDRFARAGGVWHFAWRDYSLHDLIGDMSRHSTSWRA